MGLRYEGKNSPKFEEDYPNRSSSQSHHKVERNTPINSEIKNYDRNNRIIRVLFFLLALLIIGYVVFIVFNEKYQIAGIDQLKVDNIVSSSIDGKLVAVAVVKDTSKTILFSRDSGNSFIDIGGDLKNSSLTDSIISILFAPNKEKVVVVTKSGNYFTNNPDDLNIDLKLRFNLSDSTNRKGFVVSGVYSLPNSDTVYVFGNQPNLLEVHLAKTTIKIIPIDTREYGVLSLSVHTTTKEVKAICYSLLTDKQEVLSFNISTSNAGTPTTNYPIGTDSTNIGIGSDTDNSGTGSGTNVR